MANDLDYYFKVLVSLRPGERCGNRRGMVFCYDGYMLLETANGAKITSCLDAARYLSGLYTFAEVAEI